MSNRVHRRENGGRNQDIEGQYSRNNGFEVEGQHSNNDGADSAERRMPRKILDPQSQFLQVYNKILLVSCVVAVLVDPLFFYFITIGDGYFYKAERCLELDKKLWATVLVLRAVTDVIYVVHISLQFRTAFIDKASEEGGETKLNTDARAIIRRYLKGYFLIDILVVLPIPQVVLFGNLTYTDSSILELSDTIKWLNTVFLFQFVPRVRPIYLSWKELTRSDGKFVGWVKAAFNFFLYILASHVMGALWYFFSIQRERACWKRAQCGHDKCDEIDYFSCVSLQVYDDCSLKTPNSTLFDFGIFDEALKSDVLQKSTNFPQIFFYCFWWGLRSLSSFGQNLQTSNYVWENCFAIFISIFGLLLFLSFIENLKNYIHLGNKRSEEDPKRLEEQSKKKKLAKQRKAKGEIQVWTERHMIPDILKHKIMQIVGENLKEDIYFNLENVLLLLPPQLKKDVKRHLCLDMLKKVPRFQIINDQLLQVFLDHLKPVHYNEHSYVFREGEPLDAMLFVTQGIVWTYTSSHGGKSGCLSKGEFYGEELLEWGFKSLSLTDLSNVPISPKTVRCHTKVEAFALRASDLKTILTQNWWQLSKMLSHITGSNLERWKPLAASSILAAWRRSPRYRVWHQSHRHNQRVLIKSTQWLTGRELTKFG